MSYKILCMKDDGGKFEDFAVLVRSSYLTCAIEQSFIRNIYDEDEYCEVEFFESGPIH